MDAGRPPASRPSARWARRVAVVVLGLAVGLPLVPPLLLRGALLRWLVARETASLCGAIRVESGSLGWLVVPDLLLGRPFAVELRGLRVAGPDGAEVLAAEHLSADVDVARNPWRIVVAPALVSRGRWRLSVDGTRAEVFWAPSAPCPRGPRARRVSRPLHGAGDRARRPRRARASSCATPASRRSTSSWTSPCGASRCRACARPARSPSARRAAWASRSTCATPRRRAAGCARDRAEPTPPSATTTALFDDVVIAHVGVSPDEPSDLVLAVAHADTGRSRLAGTAVFENVFARHGRRGERNPPGLALDARWERLTDAAARLEAPWLPREALGEILDGTIDGARARAVPRALGRPLDRGAARGHRGDRRARRAGHARRARDRPRARALPRRQPRAAPRRSRHGAAACRARARAPACAAVDLEIPARRRHAHESRRGSRAAPPRLPRGAAGPGRSRGARRRRHARARAHVGAAPATNVAARGPERALGRPLGARARSRSRCRARAAGAPAPPGRVDASVDLGRRVARALGAARDGERARRGRGHARGTARSPARAPCRSRPSTTATILGERFRAPAPVTATLDDGRALTLAGLALTRVGGGQLEARGRAERAGPLAGELRLTAYPLGGPARPRRPWRCPPALGGGTRDVARRRARRNARRRAHGDGLVARPAFAGTLELAACRLSGRRLGDGHFKVRARGWTLALEGTLGPALTLDVGATRRRDGVTADANLTLDGLRARAVAAAGARRSRRRDLGRTRASPSRRTSRSDAARRARRGRGRRPRAPRRTSGDEAEGTARGRVELARPARAVGARPRRRRRRRRRRPRDGAARAARGHDRRRACARAAPRRAGRSRSASPRAAASPSTARAFTSPASRSRPRARAVALAGDVNVDLAAPERSTLALTATARLDAGALARQARLPWLVVRRAARSPSTRARRARRARPVATGTARLDGVELRPRVRRRGPRCARRPRRGERPPPPDARAARRGHGRRRRRRAPSSWARRRPRVRRPRRRPGRRASARVDIPLSARGLRVGDARSPSRSARSICGCASRAIPRASSCSRATSASRARASIPSRHKKTASGPGAALVRGAAAAPHARPHGARPRRRARRRRARAARPRSRLSTAASSGSARGGPISGQLRGRGALLAPPARAVRAEGRARVPRPQGMMISVLQPTRTSTRPGGDRPAAARSSCRRSRCSAGVPVAGSTS